MAQAPVFLVVGIGVGLGGEGRQQVTHVAAVEADALGNVGDGVTVLSDISEAAAFHTLYLQRIDLDEILTIQEILFLMGYIIVNSTSKINVGIIPGKVVDSIEIWEPEVEIH